MAAAFYLFFAPIEATYLSSAFEKIPTGASCAAWSPASAVPGGSACRAFNTPFFIAIYSLQPQVSQERCS